MSIDSNSSLSVGISWAILQFLNLSAFISKHRSVTVMKFVKGYFWSVQPFHSFAKNVGHIVWVIY